MPLRRQPPHRPLLSRNFSQLKTQGGSAPDGAHESLEAMLPQRQLFWTPGNLFPPLKDRTLRYLLMESGKLCQDMYFNASKRSYRSLGTALPKVVQNKALT